MNIQNLSDETVADLRATLLGNLAFACDLYRLLHHVEGNLLFAPYSISVALAMTYGGARGTTEKELAQALHFTLPQGRLHQTFSALGHQLNAIQQGGDIQLHTANSLWPQSGYDFLDSYLSLIKAHYGDALTAVDYAQQTEAARQQINAWVDRATAHQINELIPDGALDSLTRLVLVNAIYFKGNWASQFAVERTIDAPFWVTNDEQVTIPMMTQTARFKYGATDDAQVLELPYQGNALSMIILLPHQRDGLEQLASKFSARMMQQSTSRLFPQQIDLQLPRFNINAQFDLISAFQALGVSDAFDDIHADFSGMDGRKQWLYITAILHQAKVEVNEEGSEAAAATAVVVGARGVATGPIPFHADHPFLFLIRDNTTGSILFLGRVMNPVT